MLTGLALRRMLDADMRLLSDAIYDPFGHGVI
jgi:hypothetical protein